MKAVLTLFFLLVTLPAHARLDETINQCFQRYGEPIAPIGPDHIGHFLKSGIAIVAHFDQNQRCDLIFFSRLDQYDDIIPLTETELTTLIQANLGDDLQSTSVDTLDAWINPATRYKASYDHQYNILMVATPQGLARHNANQSADLKDF